MPSRAGGVSDRLLVRSDDTPADETDRFEAELRLFTNRPLLARGRFSCVVATTYQR